jgi:hypothetical protein
MSFQDLEAHLRDSCEQVKLTCSNCPLVAKRNEIPGLTCVDHGSLKLVQAESQIKHLLIKNQELSDKLFETEKQLQESESERKKLLIENENWLK